LPHLRIKGGLEFLMSSPMIALLIKRIK